MKRFFKYCLIVLVVFLLLVLPLIVSAQYSPSDTSNTTIDTTICLPKARLARILDEITALNKYKDYSVACDTALSDCKLWATAQGFEMQGYITQRDAAVRAADIFNNQLQLQTASAERWKKEASDSDLRFQRAKRRGRTWGAVLGAAAGAGLLTGLVLGLK